MLFSGWWVTIWFFLESIFKSKENKCFALHFKRNNWILSKKVSWELNKILDAPTKQRDKMHFSERFIERSFHVPCSQTSANFKFLFQYWSVSSNPTVCFALIFFFFIALSSFIILSQSSPEPFIEKKKKI